MPQRPTPSRRPGQTTQFTLRGRRDPAATATATTEDEPETVEPVGKPTPHRAKRPRGSKRPY